MTRPLTERTQSICSTWTRRKGQGHDERDIVRDLANDFGIQRPAVWKALRAGGVVPPYGQQAPGTSGRPHGGGQAGYTAERIRKHIEAEECRAASERPPKNVRPATFEPCPRCGVRADVGCRHQRADGPKPLAIERTEVPLS